MSEQKNHIHILLNLLKLAFKFILVINFLITCFVILFACLSGGRKVDDYRFLEETENIAKIEIVEVTKIDTDSIEYNVILTINDREQFLNEFGEEVTCYYKKAINAGVEQLGNAIKIEYQSGNYEVVSSTGTCICLTSDRINNNSGCNIFDTEEFAAFLSKYISKK